MHTHLRGIRCATTCGRDTTEPLRTRRARPRAVTAAPRSGGRANVTVKPSRLAKPGAFKKHVWGKIYNAGSESLLKMTSHESSINTYCKYEISINRIFSPVCVCGCFYLASFRNTGHMYADNALKKKRESACASLHVVTVTHYRSTDVLKRLKRPLESTALLSDRAV